MEIGTGATITFASGFLAEILDITWSGIERISIDKSHMGSTNAKEFMPGDLFDPGELEVELLFAAETTPPFNSAPEAITVTLPSEGTGGTSTWAAQGFMTGFEFNAPLEDRQTATATIKISGAITVTA